MNTPCSELCRELESHRDLRLERGSTPPLSVAAVAHVAACVRCRRVVAAEAELIRGLRAARTSPALNDQEARRLHEGIRQRIWRVKEPVAEGAPWTRLRPGSRAARRLAVAGIAATLLVTVLLLVRGAGPAAGPGLLAEAVTPSTMPLRVVWSDGDVDVVVREPAASAQPAGLVDHAGAAPVLASSRGAEWSF